MRKLVSFLLAVCICLLSGMALAGCDEEHTHTYKTEWSKDEIHHWHECEGENCSEISDKAAHTWDDGSITVEPTEEVNGVKIYACTICGQTKTESVPYEPVYVPTSIVAAEQWEEAMNLNLSKINCTMIMELTSGDSRTATMLSFDADKMYLRGDLDTREYTVAYAVKENDGYIGYRWNSGFTEWMKNSMTVEEYEQEFGCITPKLQLSALFSDSFSFDDATYNEASRSYCIEEISWVDEDGRTVVEDIEIKFEDGKLVSMTAEVLFWKENELAGEGDFSFTVQYGKTNILLPNFDANEPPN